MMKQTHISKKILMFIGLAHFWRVALLFVFLNICLVGSCRTGELQKAFSAETGVEVIKMAALSPAAGLNPITEDAENNNSLGYLNTVREYISDAPDMILKLTKKEIGLIFGQPAMVREDDVAKVWQYQKGTCVLDLYFYQKTSSDDEPITHYDLREQFEPFTTAENKFSSKGCLKNLLNRSLQKHPETV